MDTTRGSTVRWLRGAFAGYLFYCSLGAFALAVGCYTGLVPLYREAPLYLRISLPSCAQTVLEPGEVVRRIGDNTILLSAVREAPLHSRVGRMGLGSGGFDTSSCASLFGYRPVLLPRAMSRPTWLNTTPRSFRRALSDPAVPRIGFGVETMPDSLAGGDLDD
jgi:hypothetical protein